MIEVLYFEGCPHWAVTLSMTREVLKELGGSERIETIVIRDHEEAQRLRFLGSPTVRVDGVDIEPEAASLKQYALACRTYGASGIPPRNLLVAALSRRNSNR